MSTVFVGLSGGVDSAVTAALLKERGHTVVGAFIKIWQPEFLECTWKEDRLSALRVAAALGIPFREVDLSEVYKQHVVDEMLATYNAGLTPNPDVLCNQFVKFGAFADWAFAQGAAYVATGHHARVAYLPDGSAQLLKGVDPAKEQSYFLWAVPHGRLRKSFMPVGEMQKTDVRAYAARAGIPNARRPDSQGLCFVGDVGIRELLQRYLPQKAGAVVTEEGIVVGEHAGIAFYTIGERHGFTITTADTNRPTYYITRINATENQLIVSANPQQIARTLLRVVRTNWINGAPTTGTRLEGVVRYHAQPQSCTVAALDESSAELVFDEPQVGAPGQSLVLYDGDICRGGGIMSL